MKVVLDTNVLISALLWHGRSNELIPLLEAGKITACFSEETIDELRKVLSRNVFQTRLNKLDLPISSVVEGLTSAGEIFKLPKTLPIMVRKDPSDDKFLYLAKVARTKYIVSGDKHLLDLKDFEGIKIVSVDRFLSLVS